MRLAFRCVFGFIPVPIFYVASLAAGRGGESRGPIVRILDRYRAPCDEGLHQHELEHVRQFWRLPVLHSVLYAFRRSYRLACEAAAYRVQMNHPNGRGGALALEDAAWYLANDYRLGITVEEARAAILAFGALDPLTRIA